MRKFFISLLMLTLSFTAFAQEEEIIESTPSEVSAPAVLSRSSDVILTKDNSITLNDYFYGESVANLTQQAKDLDAKLPSGEPLYLVLNSGGGSIEAGIEAIQNLNTLNRPVHTITLFAASMGFQTVEGVKGERLITKNGTLMSHKARGRFSGEFPGQLDSRYGHYLKRVLRLDKDVVGRTSGKHTLESYASLIENEYWCDGEDCLAQGFADRVVNPSCDQSLQGTHNRLYDRWFFRGNVIEIVDVMADCPLNTEPLSYNIFINGEPLFSNVTNLAAKANATSSVKQERDSYFYTSTTRTATSGISDESLQSIKEQIDDRLAVRKVGRPEIRYY